MDKAAQRALEKCPKRKDGQTRGYICDDDDIRRIYSQGYRRAEKDLALTWEDMVKVVEIVGDLGNHSDLALRGGTTGGIQPLYEEVLRRFNAYKQESNESKK